MRRIQFLLVVVAVCGLLGVPVAAWAAKPVTTAAVQVTVNGTVTEVAGPAIAGATVVVAYLDKGVYETVATLSTAADGAWSYGGKKGSYRFEFSAEGADPATVLATYGTNGTYALATVLQAYGAIVGTVREATGGLLLPGATLEFFAAAPGGGWEDDAAASVVALDGTYTSPQLPTGSYAVRASATGYAASFYGGITPVAVPVTRATTNTGVDIDLTALPAFGTIRGRVVVGVTETPVVNTFVWLYRQNADGTWPPTTPGWGTPTKTVYTDSAGNYTSGDIALGNWKVRFYANHFPSQWWEYVNYVDVTTVDLATVVELTEPGQTVTGIDGWFAKP